MYPKIRFVHLVDGVPVDGGREIMLDRHDVKRILGTNENIMVSGNYVIWRSFDERQELVAYNISRRQFEHFMTGIDAGREVYYGGIFAAGIISGLISGWRDRHHEGPRPPPVPHGSALISSSGPSSPRMTLPSPAALTSPSSPRMIGTPPSSPRSSSVGGPVRENTPGTGPGVFSLERPVRR